MHMPLHAQCLPACICTAHGRHRSTVSRRAPDSMTLPASFCNYKGPHTWGRPDFFGCQHQPVVCPAGQFCILFLHRPPSLLLLLLHLYAMVLQASYPAAAAVPHFWIVLSVLLCCAVLCCAEPGVTPGIVPAWLGFESMHGCYDGLVRCTHVSVHTVGTQVPPWVQPSFLAEAEPDSTSCVRDVVCGNKCCC